MGKDGVWLGRVNEDITCALYQRHLQDLLKKQTVEAHAACYINKRPFGAQESACKRDNEPATEELRTTFIVQSLEVAGHLGTTSYLDEAIGQVLLMECQWQ